MAAVFQSPMINSSPKKCVYQNYSETKVYFVSVDSCNGSVNTSGLPQRIFFGFFQMEDDTLRLIEMKKKQKIEKKDYEK